MIQLTIAAIDNKNLFSNYYLDNQIKTNPEWKKDVHNAAFSEIKSIYDTESAFLENLNEKQLEQRFFGPIFKILNHTVEVNEGTETQEFLDYAFFPDRSSLDDAHKNKGTISFYNNAFAIGEVKRWGVELDRFGWDKYDRKRNPSLQIWIYLDDTARKWGVLSNGSKWRLYCKDKRRGDYYEVDLPTLLATNDVENFRYFYYFFRREAFLPSQDGEPFLERVLRGSADYAKAIGDDLKENVYKAMKKVAEGLFNWTQNGLNIQSEASREMVQKTTMLLLYRLLFLLYAEGKGLLNLGDPRYRDFYSFYRLKKEVKDKRDGPMQQRYLPVGTSLWFRLKDLFRLINLGSESFGIPKSEFYVPAYNGGLFNPDKNPELEKWIIGDAFLADAIDLLSRSKADGGRLDFVDYSTLEIRHLGSIYEGLLEYKLRVAEEDMVVIGGEWVKLEDYNKNRKQKKTFLDFDEFDRVKKGQLYLATDKGERKATGSYYTPDYIVNYIVKNTVGPVVEEKWKEAEAKKQSPVDATLSVKVLDPAMGSGHFLVGSIEFLAGKLLEAAQNDIEAGRISDDAHFTADWARREVVAHCIYGVDLNDLAVELAKVSLWLTTISKDKPLSFLDHRLKQGNSLIGAVLSDLKYYPGAKEREKDKKTLPSFVSPWFLKHLIGKIKELEEIKEDTLSDIKKKEKVFEEFKALPQYRKAKAIASVHTAVYFGNEVEPTRDKSADRVYHDLFWAVGGDEAEWQRKISRQWFRKAHEIAEKKAFFHWELEFPEIFFEGGAPKENPGWDAVVGNPPYVRVHKLDSVIKKFLWTAFPTYQAKSDILNCFIEKGITLLRDEGSFSYITSDTWRILSSAVLLRKFLLDNCAIKKITILPDKVFEDASVKPVILITEKQKELFERLENLISIYDLTSNNEIATYIQKEYTHPPSFLFHEIPQNHIQVRKKVEKVSEKLEKCVNIDFGLKTGDDSLFIKKSFENPEDKKIIASELIGRYHMEWGGDYVWYVPEKMRSHRNTARPGTKNRFEKEKLVISRMADRLSATYDFENYYIKDAFVCHATSNLNLRYVLSLLNSKLLDYYYNEVFTTVDFHRNELLQLPIRCISFTTSPDRRAALVEEAKALYSEFLSALDSANKLMDFVSMRLEAKPEASDIVHDLLAYLAERMIKMNKEKNKEIKSFLSFLEGELGAPIADLTNKTALQEYYCHEFRNLIDVLTRNKRKLKVGYDPKSPVPYKHLLEWYTASVNNLKPLMGKIEATDRLIDQIVYKLYGLTENEIKIVEENISGEKHQGI